jgi:hypothetical protein
LAFVDRVARGLDEKGQSQPLPQAEVGMTRLPDASLDRLIALLRDGRAYFWQAVVRADSDELRRTYGVAAAVRDAMIEDLRDLGAVSLASDPVPPSPQGFAALRREFDPARPERHVDVVIARERATLRLIERVFRSHPAFLIRRLMKQHYPQLQQSSAVLRRLRMRHDVAYGPT